VIPKVGRHTCTHAARKNMGAAQWLCRTLQTNVQPTARRGRGIEACEGERVSAECWKHAEATEAGEASKFAQQEQVGVCPQHMQQVLQVNSTGLRASQHSGHSMQCLLPAMPYPSCCPQPEPPP
jgi:hypothetical protein